MVFRRNRSIVFVCLAILLGMIAQHAYSATWALTYDLDEINMTATVTGISKTTDMSIESCIKLRQIQGYFGQTLEIPAMTTNGYCVVGIGDFAFDYAFSGERFEDDTIPTITAIAFPNTITNIGISAFNCCDTVLAIDIPSGVKDLVICDEAFHGCRLSSVSIPEGVVSIGAKAFAFQGRGEGVLRGTIVLPISLRELGHDAFGSNIVERIEFKYVPPLMSKPFYSYPPPYGDAFWQKELDEGAFAEWGAEHIICPSRYASEWKKFSRKYFDCVLGSEGRPLIVDFIFPEVIVGIPSLTGATSESVTNAILEAGFSDVKAIMDAIGGNDTNYNAFCEWAQSVKDMDGKLAGEAAVVRSKHAAVSWLLGAEMLFINDPKITIGETSVLCAENGEGGGVTFSLEVLVNDGNKIIKVASTKVAKMFEATSDLNDWYCEAKLSPVVIDLTDGSDTRLRFRVVPDNMGRSDRVFLRVKVK